MTEGFISYWTGVVKNKQDSEEYPFAKQMVDYKKVVFTKTLNKSNWENANLAKGDVVEEVNNLKKQTGKDIVVYGGAGFVSSLIKNNLIDEYHLFNNPTAIGKGLRIFDNIENYSKLNLIKSTPSECGIVVNHYEKG